MRVNEVSESISQQCKLVGNHPTKSLFAEWLSFEDIPCTEKKIHRKLIEKEELRTFAIEQVSDWIISHHISDGTMKRMKKKRKTILEKYGLNEYLSKQKRLPDTDKTMKGNATEIVLAEYLQSSSNLELLLYRLRYNPNVNQSMKGDDVLLFNKDNLEEKVILGESKFRQTPSKSAVEEITKEFSKRVKFPLSILFVANIIGDEFQNEDLADELEELHFKVQKETVPVVNVGFLLSNKNTATNVETHLHSENPNFIFLSLGLDQPQEFIQECYRFANEKIKRSIEDEE